MNPVSIEFPENIEELIEAYLLEKAQLLRDSAPKPNDYIALYIGVSVYGSGPLSISAWASNEVADGRGGVPTTRGQYVNEVTEGHLIAMKEYNPLAAKKAERAKLDAEIAALEGGAQ